jgi:D-alanine--poly(phosphoribitol) ligase subunit 2
MSTDSGHVKTAIHAKIIELARTLGNDARTLRFDQEIPASGTLDSPGLMELILWFENTYGLSIAQEDITMENLGTIDAMAGYLERSRAT